MALNPLSVNYLTPLHFKGLNSAHSLLGFADYMNCTVSLRRVTVDTAIIDQLSGIAKRER